MLMTPSSACFLFGTKDGVDILKRCLKVFGGCMRAKTLKLNANKLKVLWTVLSMLLLLIGGEEG